MRHPLATHRHALTGGCAPSSQEGRNCELSQRITTLLLFPRLDAVPGPWLLLLAATCSYVAIRALELAAL